jgi:succinoglycan biosynthesis transport protein ExoP
LYEGKALKVPVQPISEATALSENIGTSIDVHRLVSIFRRRLKLFVAVAALIFAAAALITFQQVPKYTAMARVLIDQRKQQIIAADQTVTSALPDEASAVDTETEVLRSRSIAENVASEANLFNDPDWNGTKARKGLFSTLFGWLSPESHKPVDEQLQRQQVVDKLLYGLNVARANDTFLIDVSYTSPNPADARKFANMFANAYITDQIAAKYQATQRATEWLNARLGSIRKQVNEADAAVQAYKASHNLLSSQGATLTEQEISTLDQQLALARAQQAEAEARLATAKSQLARGSTGEDVGEALNSPVVQSLRAQRAIASQQVADMSGRYGDRHPDLLKAKRQLADIDTQIHAEVTRIISNLEAQAQVARQHAASVAGSVNQTRNTLAGNNQAGVKLNELQRNADAANTLYSSFLDRFKQTTAQQGMEQSDARVISPASIPTSPSEPKIVLDLAFGLITALVGALVAIILAEIFDSGLTTADDIEHDFGIPALGSIPALNSVVDEEQGADLPEPYDYIVQKPLSGFAETFRTLRSSLLLCRTGRAVKLVAITSSLSDEGKTTSSFCLARICALSGDKTIVIDCDLRRRGFNSFIPEEHEEGLIEVLSGKRKVEDVILPDAETGATILPLGRSPYTPRDLFSSPAMEQLLTELSKTYDLVILDAPPVLAVADARAIVHRADAVVMLVKWRSTPRKAVESSLKVLQASDAYIAGITLTRVNQRQQSKFGYGDPAYYYGSYEKYYTS